VSFALMIALLVPVLAMRLDSSDAGNDPSSTTHATRSTSSRQGFGPGFNGPLLLVAELPHSNDTAALASLRALVSSTPGVVAVTQPRIAPAGNIAVDRGLSQLGAAGGQDHQPGQPPPQRRAPRIRPQDRLTVLVGGFTAGSIDFSHVLSAKLPLFFGIVILLSALLLLLIFRSIVIPIQAAIMNLLTIGAALGVTVAVFQDGMASQACSACRKARSRRGCR
jgi:RND superfamily putative drug exporter